MSFSTSYITSSSYVEADPKGSYRETVATERPRRRTESASPVKKRKDSLELVEETHAPYERIQQLIRQFSDVVGVNVRKAEQVESGGKSSPRPSHLEEAAYLSERVPGIRFPDTVAYAEYRGRPAIRPVVMKNETVCRGQQKYLLESDEQLATFRKWMKQYGRERDWIAQEYIATPGSAPNSFRVLVDCTGHIITSQVCYGPPYSMNVRKNFGTKAEAKDNPSQLLEYPESELFLNAKNIASNHMLLNRRDDSTVGGRFTLDPLPISHPYSRTELNLLRALNLNPEHPLTPQLPEEIARIASEAGKALGMKGKNVHELVLGIDFIEDAKTGKYYMLEANRRPSMVAVRDMFGSANSVKEIDAWRWAINGIMQRVAALQK